MHVPPGPASGGTSPGSTPGRSATGAGAAFWETGAIRHSLPVRARRDRAACHPGRAALSQACAAHSTSGYTRSEEEAACRRYGKQTSP